MHNYVTPESIKERVLARQGKLLSHDTIDAARTALVVVDLQNYFVAEGFAGEVPVARDIVPNVNRLAAAVRAAGGTVVWIQTTATDTLTKWANFHDHMLLPARKARRIAELDERHEGFKLFPKLKPLPTDLHIKKTFYSAFIHGSSDIDAQLRARGIQHLIIAGTATNVCCESTARDAMMLDYRVIMLSDGNAAPTDEEHAGTLNTFQLFFGDVMTTDEAAARLVPAAQRKTA